MLMGGWITCVPVLWYSTLVWKAGLVGVGVGEHALSPVTAADPLQVPYMVPSVGFSVGHAYDTSLWSSLPQLAGWRGGHCKYPKHLRQEPLPLYCVIMLRAAGVARR